MPTIFMVSLGCAKNLVDSEIMLGETLGDDFDLALEPDDADVVVINTCGFLEEAREEGRSVIKEFLKMKKKAKHPMRIIAVGCWAERSSEDLMRHFPGLDAVWGLRAPSSLGRDILALMQAPAGKKPTAGHLGKRESPRDGPRLVTTLPSFAYLRLSDGCDNRCHYCAIPLIRGPLRSRTPEAILAEARTLEEQGVRELVLISQDTTAYGRDFGTASGGDMGGTTGGAGKAGKAAFGLADLLEKLLVTVRVPRLRVLYAHPAHLDDRTMALLAGEDRLCGYLDLPIQHVADSVLSRMNRGYGRHRIEEIVTRLGSVKGFTLRTTILAGYPGETDADFREALDFVAAGHFQHLGAFAYSSEPGTPASLLPDPVAPEEARKRRDAILEAQSAVAFAWLDGRIGGSEEVLLDAMPEPGLLIGRSRREAPDADGIIFIESGKSRPGEVVSACISGREDYDLLARIVPAKKKQGKGLS